MSKLLFATLLVAFALPAPAMAAQPDYLTLFTKLGQQQLAKGVPPSCGQPRYEWYDRPAFDAIVQSPGAEGAAYGDGSCRILIAKDTWVTIGLRRQCGLIVHELWHLYGLEHSSTGVMAGQGAGFAPCKDIFREVLWCKREKNGSSCRYAVRLRRGIEATIQLKGTIL